ncbi:MAG: hypothetical protein ACE5HY_06180 [Candidatus Hydrothermarchaeales archaeon]
MEREKVGTILLVLGVLAWPVGLSLGVKPVPNILIPHLLGVIPGVYLRGSKIIKRLRKES